MPAELIELLRAYLRNECDIEDINDWVADHIWDASDEDRDFINQVYVEMIYVADGVSDEDRFRQCMRELLTQSASLHVVRPEEIVTTAKSSYGSVLIVSNNQEPWVADEDVKASSVAHDTPERAINLTAA